MGCPSNSSFTRPIEKSEADRGDRSSGDIVFFDEGRVEETMR
jgi:hypothetical protein